MFSLSDKQPRKTKEDILFEMNIEPNCNIKQQKFISIW